MSRRWGIFVFTAFLAGAQLCAQEVITGTFCNPKLTGTTEKQYLKRLKSTPLNLPFRDDFSSGESLLDNSLWDDEYVFVNNTFSINQPTLGIATFDALNENGALYDNASPGIFAADTLTTLPINLAYSASDSIYLSFLYEPGGLADPPDMNDSLTLQFYSPSESKWYSVWRTKGGGASKFNRSMLKITDAKFLKEGFRFRFTNYASLASATTEPSKAGNGDLWNLDCIELDKNRRYDDTVMNDVSFTTPLRSLLNSFEAMPWSQFKKASLIAMSSKVTIDFRNNDTATIKPRNVTPGFTITDVYRDLVVNEPSVDARNLEPLSDNTYEEALDYTYNSTSSDSALFLFRATLITDSFDPKWNDTIRYYQFFSDYFAYDDGTAEAGYGINGEGSDNAMVALRYRSFMQDSVAGIRICFNDAYNNANQRYFYLIVWADNDGKPGEVLATSEEILATPSGTNNGFMTCLLDKPVRVDGYFWVGWKQSSETFLNIGLDLNTQHLDRLWYWINGNWYVSSAPGTILLRALMTGDGSASSSDDGESLYNSKYKLFPNPATESFTISVPDNGIEASKLAIYNLSGSIIMTAEQVSDVNISHLPAGNYFVVVKSKSNKPLSVIKLIKTQ